MVLNVQVKHLLALKLFFIDLHTQDCMRWLGNQYCAMWKGKVAVGRSQSGDGVVCCHWIYLVVGLGCMGDSLLAILLDLAEEIIRQWWGSCFLFRLLAIMVSCAFDLHGGELFQD